MRLYEILTPVTDNEGMDYDHGRMADFLHFVGHIAGGYSVLKPLDGFWRDPVDDRLYADTMVPVRSACNVAQWSAIVAKASAIWPEQEAFMHYVVGEDVTFTRRDGDKPRLRLPNRGDAHA